MTEQKVKNRGWVKNVAIIFLAVMLVLTFFSNTIMNASLPEAAVQYVQSGAITTQIRGTGTISAKETYEVKTSTSRKVQSVLVSRGQQVKVGDVLILLAAGEGSELKDLQTQLDDAQYSYQQKLINMGGGSSEVTRAQEKLQEAIAKRDANVCTAEEVGCRGAMTVAQAVGADTVVVLEATTAGDIPGAPKSRVACRVGGGAVVSFMDGGTIYPRGLVDAVMRLAEEKGIRAQLKELVAGGNDASAYQRAAAGARVLALSAPVRYIHSACSVAKYDDLEQVFALASALAERSF